MRIGRDGRGLLAAVVVTIAVVGVAPRPAGAVEVTAATAAEFVAAWGDPAVTRIDVAADLDIGCDIGNRGPNAPLVVAGGGHRLTHACLTSTALLGTNSPLDLSDIELVGGRDDTITYATLRASRDLHVSDATLVNTSASGIGIQANDRSTVVDTTVDATAGGDGIWTDGAVVVERTVVRAGRTGILSTTGSLTVRDSSLVSLRDSGIEAGTGLTVERTFARGGRNGILALRRSTISNSTLVSSPAPDQPTGAGTGAALLVGRGTTTVTLSTLSALGAAPGFDARALWVGPAGALVLGGSVLTGEPADQACRIVGPVTSSGANLAADDTCGLTGPGDVVADPQVPAVDPAIGFAEPPPASPAVDLVPAELCASATDQRGVARPQGGACDAGAVEVVQVAPPTSSSSTTSTTPDRSPTPGGTAPPATPVRADARFTG